MRASGAVSFLIAMMALAGCAPRGDAELLVATTWPEPARAQVNATLADRSSVIRPPPRIAWIRLASGWGPAEAILHRAPVDAILGGSPSTFRRLALEGRLTAWREIPSTTSDRANPQADPRTDPTALALCRSRLASGRTWADGYASLIRPTGSEPVAALPHLEGVGIVRTSNPAMAFIEAIGPEPSPEAGHDPMADDLLADLLGATLVDARPERLAAVAALEKAGAAHPVAPKLTESPPWPPASVIELARKRRERGDDPAPWVETLARQIAPDASARAWLLASWDRPERPIDGDFLAELGRAAGGSLAREPRFRAWLRGEWREWARQRYRRVARRASGGWP